MDGLDKYREMQNNGYGPLAICKRAYLDNFDQYSIEALISSLYPLRNEEINAVIDLFQRLPCVKYFPEYEAKKINGESPVKIFRDLDTDKRFTVLDAMEILAKLFSLSAVELHTIIGIARNYPTDPVEIEKWHENWLNHMKIFWGDLENDEEIF